MSLGTDLVNYLYTPLFILQKVHNNSIWTKRSLNWRLYLSNPNQVFGKLLCVWVSWTEHTIQIFNELGLIQTSGKTCQWWFGPFKTLIIIPDQSKEPPVSSKPQIRAYTECMLFANSKSCRCQDFRIWGKQGIMATSKS